MTIQTWFPFWTPRSSALGRIVCIPGAGMGCSVFRNWESALPDTMEVLALQLPGRETRLLEPAFDRLDCLANAVASVLGALADQPMALFGHSLGGLIAFEVARRLPTHAVAMLCVSACRAPHRQESVKWTLDALSDPVAVVRAAYGPPVSLLPSELLEDVLPSLLADLAALDHYSCETPVELACPLHVFGGTEDETVARSDLVAWAEYTSSTFRESWVEGAHDYLGAQGPRIAATIAYEFACVSSRACARARTDG